MTWWVINLLTCHLAPEELSEEDQRLIDDIRLAADDQIKRFLEENRD